MEPTKTPLVTPSRDTLAEALCDSMCHHEFGYGECRKKADRLLASGVVRAADTLVDDEAAAKAAEVLASELIRGAPMHHAMRRALAAALDAR